MSINEELISREAVLNCFHPCVDQHGNYCDVYDNEQYNEIEALPFYEPGEIIEKDKLLDWLTDWQETLKNIENKAFVDCLDIIIKKVVDWPENAEKE